MEFSLCWFVQQISFLQRGMFFLVNLIVKRIKRHGRTAFVGMFSRHAIGGLWHAIGGLWEASFHFNGSQAFFKKGLKWCRSLDFYGCESDVTQFEKLWRLKSFHWWGPPRDEVHSPKSISGEGECEFHVQWRKLRMKSRYGRLLANNLTILPQCMSETVIKYYIVLLNQNHLE